MGGEVGHLLVGELEVAAPALVQPAAVAAAEVPQQAVVVGPLRDGGGGQGFLPRLGPGDPPPAVDGGPGSGKRLGVQHLLLAQAHFPALPEDQVQVSSIGIIVLHQFLVLVGHDALLHQVHGTVGRDLGPVVPPLAHVDAELRQVEPRALHGNGGFVELPQFRGAEIFPDHLAELLAPFVRVHGFPPCAGTGGSETRPTSCPRVAGGETRPFIVLVSQTGLRPVVLASRAPLPVRS